MEEIASELESKKWLCFKASSVKELKESIFNVSEHLIAIIFTTILTLYTLIADDVRQLICTKDTDYIVWIINCVALSIFLLELILMSFAKPDYFLGFFFWLDLISTLSMFLDIGWISNVLLPSGKSGGLSNASLVRAARASRIGSRAGRFVRVLRIFRLIRIIKLYKVSEQAKIPEKLITINKEHKKRKTKELQNAIELSKPFKDLNEYKSNFVAKDISTKELCKSLTNPAGMGILINKKKLAEELEAIHGVHFGQEDATLNDIKVEDIEITPQFVPMSAARKRFISVGAPFLERERAEYLKKLEKERILMLEPKDPSNEEVIKENIPDYTPESKRHPSVRSIRIPAENNNSSKDLSSKSEMAGRMDSSRNFGSKKTPNEYEEFEEDPTENNSVLQSRQKEAEQQKIMKQIANVEKQILEETNVGRKLSDATTKRVVVVVLILMIGIPIFSIDTYQSEYSFYQFGVSQMYCSLAYHNGTTPEFEVIWESYLSDSMNYTAPIISLDAFYSNDNETQVISLFSYGNSSLVDNFRKDDIQAFSEPSDSSPQSNFVVIANQNVSYYNSRSAILSIIRTIFVCLVLSISSLIFSQDATELVLEPIEKMLEKIKKITENPLQAAYDEEEQAYIMSKINQEHKLFGEEQQNETNVLLKIIVKIGGLLAVGFGEAGSLLIVQNLNSSGAIDPMIPGNKILAVFGFCDIRNFTDATEVLQAEVMVFVNEIAGIVHSRVNQFGGAANKNIGDAFLLVWKVIGEETKEIVHLHGEEFEKAVKEYRPASIAADLSVYAFVKIMADMNQNSILTKYNTHQGLRERIENYKVKMGFGLHIGWAIEGAIGSDYKIDASYLSPHVNMASRLEAATKQFGAQILISEKIAQICSEDIRSSLRKIDVVVLKGSAQPIGLYTFDGDFENLPKFCSLKSKKTSSMERKRLKFIQRGVKDNFIISLLEGKASVGEIYKKDRTIQQARLKFSKTFFQMWEIGFEDYIRGRWNSSCQHLAEASKMVGGDGPARTLVKFMGETNFKPPENWEGYRVLSEK